MRNIALRVIATVLLWTCAVFGAAQGTEATEIEHLQGSWTVSAAEQSGKALDSIKGGVLKISGSTFTLRTAAGNELSGTLRINDETSPKQLDFLLSTGATWQAIYSVSSTLFRLNYVEASDGAKRPSVFATTADTLGTVIVMRKNGE